MTNQQPPEFLSADCARVQDALFSQVETDVPASLNPDAQAFLELHLVHCAACRRYRQSMRHMQQSLQDLERVETPAGLEDRIMGKIAALSFAEGCETREPVGHAAPRGFNWKKFAPLAAAVLVVAVTVPLVVQSLAPQTRSAGPQVAQTPKAAFPQKAVTPTQPATANPAPQAHPEVATAMNPAPIQAQTDTESGSQVHKVAASQHPAIAARMGEPQLAFNPSDNSDVQGAAPTEQSANATNADALQIASASVSQPFGDTYASETESDVYYDPVSTLVGF